MFTIITDLNDMSKQSHCLTQDRSLLHRLSSTLYNGYDFDLNRLPKMRKNNLMDNFFNHFNGINKRLQATNFQFDNLSLYQVQIF